MRVSGPRQVIVLFGGVSSERRVSVASARNVVSALSGSPPGPRCLFLAPDGAVHEVEGRALDAHTRPFEEDFVPDAAPLAGSLAAFLDALSRDVVLLLALHGGDGENGVVQRALEERCLAFTGSGSVASAAAFDKARAKEIVGAAGVRVAPARVVSGSPREVHEGLAAMLAAHGRVVVKPVADGSSTGLHHLASDAELEEVARAVTETAVPYLVEPFLAGTELTVGVLDEGQDSIALCASEVRLEPGRAFDFQGKYLGRGTREITPAEVAPEIAAEAQRLAVTAHRALGCEGYSRTDLIATSAGVTFLETNTLPGLTAASFLPQQLAHAGRPLRDFLTAQLALAQTRITSRR